MKEKGHSEEFFGDYRDYWYNLDFLELMAKRWELDNVKTILDVGCGQCHWTKLIANFLNPNTQIMAVDYDEKWVSSSNELVDYFKAQKMDFNISKAKVEELPFDDNTFDAVTCQTVLIHISDPKLALKEMKRVLKPGGVMILAEPNNMVQAILQNSGTKDLTIEERVENYKFALIKEAGKINRGLGDSSFGDLLPQTLNKVGLKDIKSFISDKTNLVHFPYESNEMKAMIANIKSIDIASFHTKETPKEFATFNGKYDDVLVSVNNRQGPALESLKSSIESGDFYSGGGFLMYLVSARKELGIAK